MEFMIQTIILCRILMTLVQPYIKRDKGGWLAWIIFYFIFSEFIPFLILAWQIHKKSKPKEMKECITIQPRWSTALTDHSRMSRVTMTNDYDRYETYTDSTH